MLTSCATVGTKPVITDTFTINAPFDKVRAATVKFISEKNIPIKVIEKASGLLNTEFFTLASGSGISVANELNKFAVVQSNFMRVFTNLRGKLSFYVSSTDANTTQIKITSYMEVYDSMSYTWEECYSNGTVEENAFSYINQNIEIQKQ